MAEPAPLIRDVSDTARWVAVYRAIESERPDALFRDPFARRLAGPEGERIAAGLRHARADTWAFITRTVAFDALVRRALDEGADTVVNLAAGLDARPYRMDLRPDLRWVEVDLPAMIRTKEEALRGERPRCRLERVALDLADGAARRELLDRVAPAGARAVAISEGLLVYLGEEEVAALATDLAATPGMWRWVLEVASPALLRRVNRRFGRELNRAHAPLKFATPEGPAFFERYGWRALEVRSSLKEAARVHRLPWYFRPFAWLPERQPPGQNVVWSGNCLMEKIA